MSAISSEDWFVIRDPIHGFIKLSPLEKNIIDHPVFQRLRRIRQLAFTDMVYPGAYHTRFEHSLGVMHLSSRLYDTIWEKDQELLIDHGLPSDVQERVRKIIRLAALLHDVGHGPFSHTSETLLPINSNTGQRFRHEDYSVAIIKSIFGKLIKEDPYISSHSIGINEITQMIGDDDIGNPRLLFWKNLIASQLDADRMDYLLRDSYYTGTRYGYYDLERLIETIKVGIDNETDSISICTESGGCQCALELILARYSMFNQVYFHKVRRGYDAALGKKIETILPDGQFPPPTSNDITEFIMWDDWSVFNTLSAKPKDVYDQIFMERKKPVCILETSEMSEYEGKIDELGDIDSIILDTADQSPYKIGKNEIKIMDMTTKELVLLSSTSPFIEHLKPFVYYRIYKLVGDRTSQKPIVGEKNE